METSAILQSLKDILANSHQVPIKATENALSRLILRLEREIEVGEELDTLFRGETLTSLDARITYRLMK